MSEFDPESGASTPAEEGPGRPSLRGKFILASATMEDLRFASTVVLIVRHDEEGAVGLVVNRPLGVSLEEACGEDVEAARGVDVPLFQGGPCAGALVALHNIPQVAEQEAKLVAASEAAETVEVAEEVQLSLEAVLPGAWFCARREALEALMRHVRALKESGEEVLAPLGVKFIAGHAGWAPGQLETEMAEGWWQVADAAPGEIYAGGSPRFPSPPATSSLPPGAVALLAILARALVGNGDPTAGLAGGIRQWVRLSTRANLSRVIDPRRIPPDPALN